MSRRVSDNIPLVPDGPDERPHEHGSDIVRHLDGCDTPMGLIFTSIENLTKMLIALERFLLPLLIPEERAAKITSMLLNMILWCQTY